MKDYRLKKETPWTQEAHTTVWIGFFLRLVMLIIILYIASGSWDIYFLEDDVKYEEMGRQYAENASGLYDSMWIDRLTSRYISNFWPLVLCLSAKMFRSAYAARYINVILSTLCIAVVYNLCYEVSENKKTALTAARLFAYLPLSILAPCFPIKDIFIMLSVVYAFYIFVRVQKSRTVTVFQYALLITLLVCTYHTRGAVTELMVMFFLVYYLQKLFRTKNYLAAFFLLAGAAAVFVAFRSQILAPFVTKADAYTNYGAERASGLNALRVTGVADIYKLPLAYAFTMLQPMKLELFVINDSIKPWQELMSYLNMTMYPIAMGAWLYMFVKKHNLFFWLSSFVMFSAVIMLSLGVFRHYLFMLPIHIVNYSFFMETSHPNYKNRRTLLIAGSFALVALVFCYALVRLL